MATSANRFEHRTNAIDRMGRTVVYVGELLRHPRLHALPALDGRHLLLPRAALGLRHLPAVDLPLLHAAVRRRRHDPLCCIRGSDWASSSSSGLQALNWLQVMRWGPSDTRWMKRIRELRPQRGSQWNRPTSASSMPGRSCSSGKSSGGCIAYVITGVIMWFPEIFGRFSGRSLLRHSRHLGADHAVRHLRPHLSQHLRRAAHHSGDDPRHRQRSLGLDAPSGVVQRGHRTRSHTEAMEQERERLEGTSPVIRDSPPPASTVVNPLLPPEPSEGRWQSLLNTWRTNKKK